MKKLGLLLLFLCGCGPIPEPSPDQLLQPGKPSVAVEFRSEVETYRDKFGLVSPYKSWDYSNAASNNGLLYTAEYYVLLWLRGEIQPGDSLDFDTVVGKTRVTTGHFLRSPDNHNDQEAPDDYEGLMIAASLLKSTLAYEVHSAGIQYQWNYNVLHPGVYTTETFFGRMPQFVVISRMANGNDISTWDRNVMCGTFLAAMNTPVSNSGAKLLTWLTIVITRTRMLVCDQAARNWKNWMKSQFPGGMKSVAGTYFGADHPMAKYWPEHDGLPE